MKLTLTPLHKRTALIAAAAILVAGVVAGREKPAIELVQERAPRVATASADDIDLSKLKRGEATVPQNDPFKSFSQPKPQPAAVQVQAKPSAPPLPFRYFGRLTENGKTEVFVMLGEELLSIASGQQHGEYRVDQVSASQISFTYLPLKTRQTLELQ
jgi:hypothetical protein